MPEKTPARSGMSRFKGRRGLSRQTLISLTPWLAALLFLLMFAATLVDVRIADMDLWGRLAMAAVIRQAGFPFTDDFSYTAQGQPWIDHEWLSGVVFLWLLQTFGDAGLLVLKVLLFFLIPLLWGMHAIRRGLFNLASVWFWFVCALYIVFSFYNTIRAHTFSWAFLALWIYLLEKARTEEAGQDKRLLVLLPLSMCFWVNLHGGWIVGLLLLGLYYAASVIEKRQLKTIFFWPLLGALAATCLTPYHPLSFYVHMLGSYVTSRTGIEEWNAVPLLSQSLSYMPIIVLLGLVLFSAICCLKARKNNGHYLLLFILLLFSWQGLSHQKLLPIPMIAFGFFLPVLLREYFPVREFKAGAVAAIVFGCVLPGIISFQALPAFARLFQEGDWTCPPHQNNENAAMRSYHNPPYPVGAVEYLRAVNATGRLWTPFDWGEYALWHLYPNLRVSLDGRLEELYPMDLFRFSQAVSRGDVPLASLTEELQPDWVLAKPGQAGPILQKNKWRLHYADDVSLLYSRTAETDEAPVDISADNASLQEHLGDLTRFKNYPFRP